MRFCNELLGQKTFLVQPGHFLNCSATVEIFQHLSLLASRLTAQLEPHTQFYNILGEVPSKLYAAWQLVIYSS